MFDLEFFKLKVYLDKNKHSHKKDIEKLFDNFIYYVTESWKGIESKKDAFTKLYESFSRLIEKGLRNEEKINTKKYIFQYFLGLEELNNPLNFYYKNDEEFRKIYKDFISLLIIAIEKDGFFTYYEFFDLIEKLKKRYKKAFREINNDQFNYTYKTRKNFYKEIKEYFKKKLKNFNKEQRWN